MLTHKSTDIGVYTVKNDSPPPKKKNTQQNTDKCVCLIQKCPAEWLHVLGFLST